MKALFLPIAAIAGFLAGFIAKKLFGLVWSAIDDSEPPDPKERVGDHRKLLLALGLQGAIAGVAKGGLDHASRHGFARLTGSWPGEESSDSDWEA